MPKGRPSRPAPERFWEKVEKTDTCWLWVAATNSKGYGQFVMMNPKRLVPAHRWAYESLVGPIPEGLTIDHLCRVHNCVNPAHLEAVTMRENVLRGDTVSGRASRQTHCAQGHPFDEENTKYTPRQRRCRTCKRLQQRQRRTRLRGPVR